MLHRALLLSVYARTILLLCDFVIEIDIEMKCYEFDSFQPVRGVIDKKQRLTLSAGRNVDIVSASQNSFISGK